MNFRKFLPIRFSKAGVKYFDEILGQIDLPVLLLSVAGEIIRCNPAAQRLFNLPLSRILEQDFIEFFRQNDMEPPFSSVKKMLNEATNPSITIIKEQGQPDKTIQWSASPIKVNNCIESIYLEGFDISYLINTTTIAKQLQNSIIDHIPNHFIFWKDRNSVYLGCNEALAKSLGLKSSKDIIGKTDFDLPTTKEESEAYRADDRFVMETKQPKLNIEETQTLADGTKKILLTSKVPLFDVKGEVYGVLAIYSDITLQKLNEQKLIEANQKLERSYKVKTEFIRNISHDIRTPLSGIEQILRAIYEGKIQEEEIPEFAFSGWEASKKLMELFEQIIEVSRHENYDFEDKIEKFDLYSLLEGIGKTYEVNAKHKNLKLEIEYSSQVPHYLKGKHWRLHRVLMNLLGNALKFTKEGEVKLVVERSQEKDDTVILRFSVIDTGIGIPKEKHNAIFEPFIRLTPAFEGQYPGSGLGLHLVKEYIEKMSGEIYVESCEGKGSMFTCVLPFKKPLLDNDNDVAEAEYVKEAPLQESVPIRVKIKKAEVVPIKNQPTEKIPVLLVEDDVMIQRISLTALKDRGYEVDLAKNGEEALDLTSKKLYSIIYMDIGLGAGIDGIETTRCIRSDPNNLNKHTFITAITAHGNNDEAITIQCMEAGMQHILAKPLTPEKIIHIQNLVQKTDGTETENKVIDFDLWRSRLGETASMIDELLHMLGKDFDNNKQDIKEAYEAHDLQKLKAVTHKLKGALSYCGFPRLEAAMKAIELAAKNANSQQVDKLYPETMAALDEAQEAYKEWAEVHPEVK